MKRETRIDEERDAHRRKERRVQTKRERRAWEIY